MADFWFGAGAFERMPPPMKEFLVADTRTMGDSSFFLCAALSDRIAQIGDLVAFWQS